MHSGASGGTHKAKPSKNALQTHARYLRWFWSAASIAAKTSRRANSRATRIRRGSRSRFASLRFPRRWSENGHTRTRPVDAEIPHATWHLRDVGLSPSDLRTYLNIGKRKAPRRRFSFSDATDATGCGLLLETRPMRSRRRVRRRGLRGLLES